MLKWKMFKSGIYKLHIRKKRNKNNKKKEIENDKKL